MKRQLFLLGSLFFILVSFAQYGYMDGYIVTLTGDTIRGKIKDRKYSARPGDSDKIKFIDAKGNESKKTPDQIKLYCKKGSLFFYSLPIGMERKPKFAEILEYGDVLLFGYNNESFMTGVTKTRKLSPGKTPLPENIEYLFQRKNDVNSLMKVRPKDFESTASFYFQKDAELKKKIEDKTFTYEDIRLIVKTYNAFIEKK